MNLKTLMQKNQWFIIVILDCMMMVFSGVLSMLARFDFSFAEIPEQVVQGWLKFLPIQFVITLLFFWWRKMYHYLWRTVSAADVANMVVSVCFGYLLSVAAGRVAGVHLPGSVYFLLLVFLLLTQVGMRCVLRFYETFIKRYRHSESQERIMIIGAGEAGQALIREIHGSEKIIGKICCIIDDDEEKWNKRLDGVPVLGGRDRLAEIAARERITQIIFAIPTASAQEKRDILDICKMTKIGRASCRERVFTFV